ncbi:MAG: hypothetical protein A3K19_08630 [Lentisphaerae bacterium RIFOXYB12_FULL_65_16]|nr:MAG: hypothetical protein A3K18_05635 [Lentisphaerae bacterium RIFOXYA12_64_32]OGV89481.1 MAG: hypothetical protein A3K19_08630 [Lentisphaerae bacterium RIFOXYB12_FULL_65_16]
MFIDIHGHTTTYPELVFPGRKEPFATPEQLIAMYDEVGITKAVLLPCVNPECLHMVQSNEEILDVAARYPDRFIPFCNLDPRLMFNTPKADFSPLLEHYKAKGCKGIGEVCANLWFDDPRVTNLFDHAQKCSMPVTFHVAVRDGNIYGLIDELGLPRFEKQVQAHPELVFLCHSQSFWAHMSADVTAETWGGYPKGPVVKGGRVPELMRRYPTVCGDLSAGSGHNAVSRDPAFGYEFLDEFQDQLLFGTDVCSPANRADVLVWLKNVLDAGLAEKRISQAVYDKVTHGNAERILGL